MKDKTTGEDKFIWRMKGLPMTYDNKEKLTWDRFKEMVLGYGNEDENVTTESFKIEKNFRIEVPRLAKKRKGGIITAPMEKKIRPVINKGVVINPQMIVPFGASTPLYCKTNNPNPCVCKDDANFETVTYTL